jgi:hypothetical protein
MTKINGRHIKHWPVLDLNAIHVNLGCLGGGVEIVLLSQSKPDDAGFSQLLRPSIGQISNICYRSSQGLFVTFFI